MSETPNTEIISRIAPTPSGYLHLGNAINFILTWVLVRKNGGRLILRIDDMDGARCRPEFIEDIFSTLDWLNIDYDEGPAGPDDFRSNFSMQKKTDYYFSILSDMAESKEILYACTCSRKKISAMSPEGIYHGHCRDLGRVHMPDESAIRVKVPVKTDIRVGDVTVDLHREFGDFVVWRKDNMASYQFASLIEDRDNHVNLIVRGEDLRPSTAAQMYLAEFADADIFLKCSFIHHRLLVDGHRNKLSKSDGAYSVKQIRENGGTPRDIYKKAASFLGIQPEAIEHLSDFPDYDWPPGNLRAGRN